MIRVLFVCLGNICRSPMAEAVFRRQVEEAGLSEVIRTDSAGTGDWHIGHPPHEGTRKVLELNGVSHEGIRARQVSGRDFEEHRYVIAMDASNVRNLASYVPKDFTGELKLLMDFVPGQQGKEVPDPYYTGNFEEVYGMVTDGCARLLAYIRSKEGI